MLFCWSCLPLKRKANYSQLSLSWTHLFGITAYLEVKIWSLFWNETLTTGNKIMWKRGKIAPKEQLLLFFTIFSVYLDFQESNYIFICEMWLFDLSFFFSILQIWYVEIQISQSISENPMDFEMTRVDCISAESVHSIWNVAIDFISNFIFYSTILLYQTIWLSCWSSLLCIRRLLVRSIARSWLRLRSHLRLRLLVVHIYFTMCLRHNATL